MRGSIIYVQPSNVTDTESFNLVKSRLSGALSPH